VRRCGETGKRPSSIGIAVQRGACSPQEPKRLPDSSKQIYSFNQSRKSHEPRYAGFFELKRLQLDRDEDLRSGFRRRPREDRQANMAMPAVRRIYEANRDVLKDPDKIYRLKLRSRRLTFQRADFSQPEQWKAPLAKIRTRYRRSAHSHVK
jgi:hypothetical protein